MSRSQQITPQFGGSGEAQVTWGDYMYCGPAALVVGLDYFAHHPGRPSQEEHREPRLEYKGACRGERDEEGRRG